MVTPHDAALKMFSSDEASNALGMKLLEVDFGRAVISMTVREDMVNGMQICHGGFIFTLADSAMAFATNSYNHWAVATHADIHWLSPARVGMELVATASEVSKRSKSAVTDVVVEETGGTKIAVFRGSTRQVEGLHIDR